MNERSYAVTPWMLVAVAAGASAIAAGVDQGLRWLDPRIAVSPTGLFAVWALYLVVALLVVFFLDLVGAVTARARRLAIVVPVPLMLLIVLGGWVNLRWLPSLFDVRSLAFDAVALVLTILAAGLGRRLVDRIGPRAGAMALLAVACVFAVISGVTLLRAGADAPVTTDATEAVDGPDLVVVLMDALRADHCSAYGYERLTTPNLDRLAREGVLFENVYSVSSWTKPTVATLFTGLYPAGHGNHAISAQLPKAAVTLPQRLREAGLTTAVFAENRFVSRLFGFDKGVDHLVGTDPDVVAQTVLGHVLLQVAVRAPVFDHVLDAARVVNRLDPRQAGRDGAGRDLVRSVDAWLADRAADERLFAYVHLMKPHAPYLCPAPFDGAFGEPSPEDGDSPVEPPHVEGLGPFAAADGRDARWRERLIANYDERLLYGDDELGRVLERFAAHGRDDLIVVVVSDHGEEFGENGLFDHGHSLQEGVVRVPMVVWGPGHVRAGARVGGVARLVDLAPTLLDLAGLPPEPQFDGSSLVPALSDSTAGDRPVLLELEHGPDFWMRGLVRAGARLKYVRTRQSDRVRDEVFDLAADPAESASIAVAGEDPLVWMKAELDAARAAAARHGYVAEETALDPDTEARLRALGYIE